MIYDLTKEGGWHADLPVEAVVGFIDLMDLWPGDVLKVRDEDGQHGTIHLVGTDEWVIRGDDGRELGRGRRPKAQTKE